MTDYLLVHGAGQGAWCWGRVWGHMTAPAEHPPRLYAHRPANRVYPLDLPGHGADAAEDTGAVLLDECVHSITRTVERQGLRDLVLVGHGFAGSLMLQAAVELPQPPKRLVLVAGIIPGDGKSMVTVLPHRTRRGFQLLAGLSKLSGRDLKLPSLVISNFLCNGMDPMQIVQAVGFFGPLPTRVLTTRVSMGDMNLPCPVSYVVLTQDRILPEGIQRQMAGRLPDADIIELESCHEAMLYKPRELAEILLSFA